MANPTGSGLNYKNSGKAFVTKGYEGMEIFRFASANIMQKLPNWIKQYSEVKIDDNTVLTANQIKELQKRNAQLEEENLILKKAIAIFTPHSNKD